MNDMPPPVRPSKTVTVVSSGNPTFVIERVIQGVPFLKNFQIKAYLAGMAGAVLAFCHFGHIPIPYTEYEVTGMIACVFIFFALGVAIWKRIQAGKDPLSPAAPLTLK